MKLEEIELTLRRELSTRNFYEVVRQTELKRSSLYRFMDQKGSLSAAGLFELAEALGFELTLRRLPEAPPPPEAQT